MALPVDFPIASARAAEAGHVFYTVKLQVLVSAMEASTAICKNCLEPFSLKGE